MNWGQENNNYGIEQMVAFVIIFRLKSSLSSPIEIVLIDIVKLAKDYL